MNDTSSSPAHVTKDQFAALLRDSGVTPEQMAGFHRRFEHRHPRAHEAFLHWLRIEPAEITSIRSSPR